MPLERPVPYLASEYAAVLNAAGVGCQFIYDWNGVSWDIYAVGPDLGDFTMLPVKGYFIYCSTGGTVTLTRD